MNKSLVLKSTIILITLCTIGSACLAMTIPQIALGGGYEGVLFVRNLTGSQWDGSAILQQGNKRPWKGSWSLDGVEQTGTHLFEIHLPPGQTRKYVLSGSSLSVGYLNISATGGRIPAQGELLVSFFYKVLDQSAALVDSVGVPESLPATEFVFTVEKTNVVDTGFAFASFSRENDFKIDLTLYGEWGDPIETADFRYAGHKSQFFSELFQVYPDFVGSVSVRSEEMINLTVIRLESQESGFQLTSVPPTGILRLLSPNIVMGQTIPDAFSCKQSDTSPALHWNRLPSKVASWALILEDPDAPGELFVHWIMFDIPGTVTFMQQNGVPSGAKQGRNDFGELDYGGPCAPPDSTHRYFFKLYALDVASLNLNEPNRDELLAAMEGHVIATTQLMGTWAR